MRELTQREMDHVSGGNLITWTFWGMELSGAFGLGYSFGEQINEFNQENFGMSLGEAVYYTVN